MAALVAPIAAAVAAPDAEDPFEVTLSDRYSYDDNLFRVPDGLSQVDPDALAVESLDDYANRASVGIQARMDAARQVFALKLRFDDVRYARNDMLDYRGGSGELAWDWKLAGDLSGRVNAKYDRALASFSNYRLFIRDVVDVASYGGELRYAIGSRWALLGGASFVETDHSAQIRKIDKFKGETLRGGIEYRSPTGNVLALDHRDTSARFPIADRTPGGLPFRYDEQQQGLTLAYALTAITQLRARVAYLERDYADPRLGDFSGTIGNVVVHWAPRAKLYLDLKTWRELTAYSDAESDYFVSDGVSITPTWEVTSKLALSAEISHEQQEYLGDNTSPTPSASGREDEVSMALLNIDYTPRDYLTLGLAYRWVERDSNRELRDYDNGVASLQVTVRL